MGKLLVSIGIVFGISIAAFGLWYFKSAELLNPISEKAQQIVEKPLEKYAIPRLKQTQFASSAVTIGKTLKDNPQFTSRMFYYTVNGKKMSGLLNTPKESGEYPLIVMFRGFVPLEIYTTGEGTRRSGEVFAQNGFVTVAPDFFGFGEADGQSASSLEDRFQTYTTALTLLQSLSSLDQSLAATDSGKVRVNTEKVGVWGHSNGGHISLVSLAVTGKSYPTVLWNPVTKPFPYSILYFTDESDDNGKALRKVIADFEDDYDIELYSPTNYYEWINAPIQLHQGADDEAVPLRWSNQFVEKMEKLEKEVEYFVYPGDDHNFAKGSWSKVVERNIAFFKKEFSK